MFCMKCGTQLADDAAFCFNCGNKIEANEPAAVNTQSFSAETAQTEEQGAYYHQPAFHQQMNGTVQPVYQQPVFKNQIPVKKGSKAMIPAMIFVVLSVFASIMVSISSFMGGEVGVGFENIAFAVCSILIAVYATSKSTVTSVLKGVGLVAVTALHAIFYGVAGFMTAIGIFGTAKNGTDYYFAVILLLELILFYTYMIVNIIRCFMNSKKVSSVMLLFGYLSALLMVAAFVVDAVSRLNMNEVFAFGFIPNDLGLVCMILADIFAVISRAKKQAQ